MKQTAGKSRRLRQCLAGLVLAGTVIGVSGCHTVSYYAQAIKGQCQILAHEKRIDALLKDPGTPEGLKQRFQRLGELRAFAKSELKLPLDGDYRKYVDVHRPYVVWNVEAAPEFSMAPRSWWYPFVGRLDYRGYFSQRGATNYGAALSRRGYDVSIEPVQAYSTLGWFNDPVLNTFIFEPDAELAEILFHELGHQRVFASGDTDFNEAFATVVGEEGARRWLKAQGDQAACERYQTALQRHRQFVTLVMKFRTRLEQLYGDVRTADGLVKANKGPKGPPAELREQKQRVFLELRESYARLKQEWDGDTTCDGWFARELNNASLNSVAEYYDLVPGFEQLLAEQRGKLEEFYRAAERLAKMPNKARQQQLRSLAAGAGVSAAARH